MPVLDLAECLAKVEAVMAAEDDVRLAYVFGSQARARARADSDLDVAVLLAGDPDGRECLQRQLDLMGRLSSAFQTNAVDVVILNKVDLALRHQVIRYGKLAFARDRDEAIEYRVRTSNLYLDFLPFLRRDEQAFFQRIREGRMLDGFNPYKGAVVPDPPVPVAAPGAFEPQP